MYILLGFLLFCGLRQSLGQYEGDSCSSKRGQGVCRYLTECQSALAELQSGQFPKVCGYEGTQTIVCCFDTSSGSISTKPTTPPTRKTTTTTTRTTTTTTTTTTRRPVINSRLPGDISKQKCKDYAKYAYEQTRAPILIGGKRKPQFTNILECPFEKEKLIVGGKLASRQEFPHMAQVGFKSGSDVLWDCAGSIISERFILTAGHCLKTVAFGPPQVVRVGITNQSDTRHMQERNIAEIIQHPDFNFNKYNDIGLLKLDRNLDLNIYVRPICLYTDQENLPEKAIASGWGKVEYAGEGSRDLLKVVLEHFDVVQCNNTYRRDIIQENSSIKDGIRDDIMICYGSRTELKDTCQGDSGGPLQYYVPETPELKCMYWLLGVTSFGKSCGTAVNLPGVYTRISTYVKWIEDITWP